MTTRMSASEIDAYLDEVFPQLHYGGRTYFIEAVGPMTARMRCDYHEKHLRPGGTISGPTMRPGVSQRIKSGMSKASQIWTKRAAFSQAGPSMAPARNIGWLAITPTVRPPWRSPA